MLVQVKDPNNILQSTQPTRLRKGTVLFDDTNSQVSLTRDNKGFQKALDAALQKQMFAQQMKEVYSKGENKNYDAYFDKMKKRAHEEEEEEEAKAEKKF